MTIGRGRSHGEKACDDGGSSGSGDGHFVVEEVVTTRVTRSAEGERCLFDDSKWWYLVKCWDRVYKGWPGLILKQQ